MCTSMLTICQLSIIIGVDGTASSETERKDVMSETKQTAIGVKRTGVEYELIELLRQKGVSFDEIASRIGTSKQNVSKILKMRNKDLEIWSRVTYPAIGDILRKNHWTASEFANQLGINKLTLLGYLGGEHQPKLDFVLAMEDMLGKTALEIFAENGGDAEDAEENHNP